MNYETNCQLGLYNTPIKEATSFKILKGSIKSPWCNWTACKGKAPRPFSRSTLNFTSCCIHCNTVPCSIYIHELCVYRALKPATAVLQNDMLQTLIYPSLSAFKVSFAKDALTSLDVFKICSMVGVLINFLGMNHLLIQLVRHHVSFPPSLPPPSSSSSRPYHQKRNHS